MSRISRIRRPPSANALKLKFRPRVRRPRHFNLNFQPQRARLRAPQSLPARGTFPVTSVFTRPRASGGRDTAVPVRLPWVSRRTVVVRPRASGCPLATAVPVVRPLVSRNFPAGSGRNLQPGRKIRQRSTAGFDPRSEVSAAGGIADRTLRVRRTVRLGAVARFGLTP